MAHDDMFVIIYQVLKYLYECLKKGQKPDRENLTAAIYSIPENYWQYILYNLYGEGYVAGIKSMPTKEGLVIGDIQEAIITMKGVEYLLLNDPPKMVYCSTIMSTK